MRCGISGLCVVMLLAVSAPALARFWKVDGARSTLSFIATCRAAPCAGRFHHFTADIVYDPADVPFSKFDVVVDVASLRMQDSASTRRVLGSAFLNAAKFPRAYFTTTMFQQTATHVVKVTGPLKLHGVVRSIDLDVVFVPHRDTATLDVTAHLHPADFGIVAARGSTPPTQGNDVTVHGHFLLHAAQ